MPSPVIKLPKSVSIARDGQVYVWRKPNGEDNVGNNPIGSVHQNPDGKGWIALDRDGNPANDKDGAPLGVLSGQRLAARELCRSQGLWPEDD